MLFLETVFVAVAFADALSLSEFDDPEPLPEGAPPGPPPVPLLLLPGCCIWAGVDNCFTT